MAENTTMVCTLGVGHSIICNGTTYNPEETPLTYKDEWFWIYFGIYAGLVLFAGLASGLTLGLLSLDVVQLRVIQEGGTPRQQRYADRILPLVKRHHLLLVTLLLSNAVAVETMPLCLDRISDPITAILVSVTAVLLFGEVFPQAICSRYGLGIGAILSPLVYFLMVIFFVVAFPLSKLLDCLLGKDHATFFRRAELKALVDLHGPSPENEDEDGARLTTDEVMIIKGAIELRDKTVKDAMVPLSEVFMLDHRACLDDATMTKIVQVAHSRIPIYEDLPQNVIGVLLVKTLIKYDPDDQTPVAELMSSTRSFKSAPHILDSTPLYDILNEFQTGKSHLCVVRRSPEVPDLIEDDSHGTEAKTSTSSHQEGEVVGIITLEDVLEQLLQEEILDEMDVYKDFHKQLKLTKAKMKHLLQYQSSIEASGAAMNAENGAKGMVDPLKFKRPKTPVLKAAVKPDDDNAAGVSSPAYESDSPTTPLIS